MAIAGTLTVNILARTLGFERGIGRARKGMRGFNKDVTASSVVMGRLKTTIAGILGGLTVRAGFNFLNNQLRIADALSKSAETLNLTTGELGEFQLAAKLAGVDSRQLNISIQRMSRRIGEAALGSGELAKTLIRLGLDAQQLSRLSISDQFLAMGKSLSSITNQDEQLAAIFKTFDSEGVAVFRAFKTFEQARAAFRRFNLELGAADSKSLQEIANQATIIKEVFGIQGRKLLVDVGPQVLGVLDKLLSLAAPRDPDAVSRPGETAFETAVRRRRELRQTEGELPSDLGRAIFDLVKSSFRKASEGLGEQAAVAFGTAGAPGFGDPRNMPFGLRQLSLPVPPPVGASSGNRELEDVLGVLRQIAGFAKTTSENVERPDF